MTSLNSKLRHPLAWRTKRRALFALLLEESELPGWHLAIERTYPLEGGQDERFRRALAAGAMTVHRRFHDIPPAETARLHKPPSQKIAITMTPFADGPDAESALRTLLPGSLWHKPSDEIKRQSPVEDREIHALDNAVFYEESFVGDDGECQSRIVAGTVDGVLFGIAFQSWTSEVWSWEKLENIVEKQVAKIRSSP